MEVYGKSPNGLLFIKKKAEFYGFRWISMDFDGFPWILMDFDGFRRIYGDLMM